MKQADLVKLAGIARRENDPGWQPHEDLNQAFLCLGGLGYRYSIHRLGENKFRIEFGDYYTVIEDKLAPAICRAILWATT